MVPRKRKLRLRKTTLRNLSASDAALVRGATPLTPQTCDQQLCTESSPLAACCQIDTKPDTEPDGSGWFCSFLNCPTDMSECCKHATYMTNCFTCAGPGCDSYPRNC